MELSVILTVYQADALKEWPYLDPSFGQVDPEGDLLAEKYIRVMRLLEQRLQFLQLLRSESSSISAL
jgi:hypothetical protein